MLLKHIVVGWHRGGLGYAGQFLEGCGKSVGYTFGPDFTRSQMEEKLEQAREIEVSPWLVPYLGHPLLKDVPVTFLLRDPMRVFNSLKHLGHFQLNHRTQVEWFAFGHMPELAMAYRGKPLQAVVAYLTGWLKLAKQLAPSSKLLQVEEFPYSAASHFGCNARFVPYLEPTVNASETCQVFTPGRLPEKVQEPMLQLLKKTGYMYSIPAPYAGHPHFMNTDWHL